MNWLFVVNDTHCKQDLQNFLRKNEDSILFKTSASKIIQESEGNFTTNCKVQAGLITVNSSSHLYITKIEEIIRCQSQQNYTQIFLKSGKKITSTKTLKHFETLLSEKAFVRIHQSHLVNLFEVSSIHKSKCCVILGDGTELPIATRKKESLINQIEKL